MCWQNLLHTLVIFICLCYYYRMKLLHSLLLLLTLSFNVYAYDRIVILDTGLDLNDARFEGHICTTGHKDFTGQGLHDYHGHGTHVAGLVMQYAKNSDYCLIIVKYFVDDGHNNNRYIKALNYASSLNPSAINYSGEGPGFSSLEWSIISMHPNVQYIVAAGNEGVNMDNTENCTYPACYNLKNVVVVGNSLNGKPHSSSNYGNVVKHWEEGMYVSSTMPGGSFGTMSGTSMSCAIHTGKYIYNKQHGIE